MANIDSHVTFAQGIGAPSTKKFKDPRELTRISHRPTTVTRNNHKCVIAMKTAFKIVLYSTIDRSDNSVSNNKSSCTRRGRDKQQQKRFFFTKNGLPRNAIEFEVIAFVGVKFDIWTIKSALMNAGQKVMELHEFKIFDFLFSMV